MRGCTRAVSGITRRLDLLPFPDERNNSLNAVAEHSRTFDKNEKNPKLHVLAEKSDTALGANADAIVS